MNTIKYTLTFGFMLLLLNCSNNAPISEDEKIAIEKEIKERLDAYPEAVKRKDMDWVHNFWSQEKDLYSLEMEKIETNYDSTTIKKYQDAFSTLKEVLYFRWINGHAYILNREAVTYATNFDWGIVTISGDTIKSKGSWLYVFRKSEGNWKVVHTAGTHQYY